MAIACVRIDSSPDGLPPSPASDPRWHVIKAKPRKEAYIQVQLAHCAEIETYCPLLDIPKKRPRAGQKQLEPVFPGYVFARFDAQTQILHLRRLQGYNSLVSFDGRPATVPDDFITDLQDQEEGRGHLTLQPPRMLRADDPVQVVDGPFSGQSGVFLSYQGKSERICLLLEFMSSHRKVELPSDAVTPIAGSGGYRFQVRDSATTQ